MKKLISLVAALALVGSVAAAPKKPAKPPTAVAPVASMAAAAPATKGGDTKFNIAVWGGYNIAGKSTYVKNFEAIFDETTGVTKSNSTTMGGIAGGADFFYGSDFQFGISAGYLKGHDVTRTLVSGGTTYVGKASMDYAPILLSVRYFLMPGLYVGAGAGVASVLNGKESLTDGTPTGYSTILPTSNISYPWNLTFSGTALAVQGRIGYDFPINQNITIGAAGIFTYISADIESASTKDGTGTPKAASFSNSAIHITPALILTFKF